MTAGQKAKSSTMRIDLIPEISDVPLSTHPKQVVIPAKGLRARPQQARFPSPAQQGYQELFQSVYDAGFITDLRGRVRDVNRRAIEFFGHQSDEFKQLSVADLISGATEALVRTLYENLQHERFTLMQAYCLRVDGSSFPAEIAVSQIRLTVPHLCFFVRDVTLRHQAEEMLRTEHNALQNANDAIVVTDLDAQLEYVNPATATIWGYQTSAELIGAPLGGLLADPADAQRIISSLIGENYEWKGESVGVRANGERFRVQVSAACNRNSDGDVVGAVLSLCDLSTLDLMADVKRDLARHRAVFTKIAAQLVSLNDGLTVLGDMLAGDERKKLATVLAEVCAIQKTVSEEVEAEIDSPEIT